MDARDLLDFWRNNSKVQALVAGGVFAALCAEKHKKNDPHQLNPPIFDILAVSTVWRQIHFDDPIV